MKKKLSRTETRERIERFFARKTFDAAEVRKIKRLAMQHNLKLGEHRKRFCKKCYSDLRTGTVRVTRWFKNVTCANCGHRNRWRIS